MQSMMVDSTPTRHGPPSKIKSCGNKYCASSSSTADAVVGETAPNRFALGAAIPAPPWLMNSLIRASAIGWAGTRRPTVSCPPVIKSCANPDLLSTNVIGPGQKSRARVIAYSGISRLHSPNPSKEAICTING